ncbi:polysaccharide deacetylase [Brasilonema octagenarum UFV-E1]|uniref:Polysaccharide deacetylase n=1 Tax=Brasilonema sennae CENA114 TaxID=415709 RepID=A0A856M8W2_9CYAN|nr:polysaccharide deacetylase family protein [Brasilonema sennae]QDL07603.1 polysaccharide deacetylase [Brasilonema sennae CENA114]QDL13965.1 polysaccharide deacetylase [Brasilonema octagenarum UFV-E1]
MKLIPNNPILNYIFFNSRSRSIFHTLICGLLAVSIFLPQLAVARRRPVSKPAEPENAPTTTEACSNNNNNDISLNSQVSRVASNFVLASSWMTKPNWGLDNIVETVGPYVYAFLNRTSWPNINEVAKQARVPILMYHDILPEKQVFFDVTPEELEQHFQTLKENGITPISLDQLMTHLQTGMPLPEKPVVLTFDDGYGGHYQYVYPLLKKYGYPAVFSIYTKGVGNNVGRTHVSWEQLKEMVANPLVTIASHSVTHPADLTVLPPEQIQKEVVESKATLEANLGIPIRYFTYPAGKYNEQVASSVQAAGYDLALTMNDVDERFAGASESLLAISRFGQSRLQDVIKQAWGGAKLPSWKTGFDFASPVQRTDMTIDKIPLILVSGGKPITIHADSRYTVKEIVARSNTNAVAAVDGGFFSLKLLNSNVMIGPVYSQVTKQFIPGSTWDIQKIAARPLVLISPHEVRFIPFDPLKHNTLEGIQAEMPEVTDAFVAAAWLVKDGQPREPSSFNGLYGFDIARYRAFWGINKKKQATVGVSLESVDSISLGKALVKAGLQDVVMVDSGQSTSLVYQGESLVRYQPRPVPHAVALLGSPATNTPPCVLVQNKTKQRKT